MYRKIYVPVDNSEHAMAAIDVAVNLAQHWGATVVGSHAYAARLHDVRFKQMEFTLPEEYREESELEKQRQIHDTLITMGLQLISDSYLEVLRKRCREHNIPFEGKMFDGKNYKVIVADIKNSDYDLVVLGALGLGAVRDSLLGSVCERVVRRVTVDTLVVKNTHPFDVQLHGNGHPESAVGNGGNILVGIDGSPESFAGLRTALSFGKALNKPVEAVAVYDPYLHYTMFNSIANVLTEKASRVFKFKEQEQLHEEVIDTGLAKIYQSHLEVARRLAQEEGVNLKTTLLDGKAFEKILQYVRREQPWLLVLGRIGVHSDPDMDIGSNTENLLRLVPCNVLLSSKRFVPPIDVKAEESMTWTDEALDLLNTAPEAVRGIARTTIHRWAMERGHSVITRKVIEQAMATILPPSAMQAMGIVAEEVALERGDLLSGVTYVCRECGYAARNIKPVRCPVCSAGSERFGRLDKEALERLVPLEGTVTEEETFDRVKLRWTSEAKKALREVPSGYQRRRTKAQIEKTARVRGLPTITRQLVLEVAGDVIEETRQLAARGRLSKTETMPAVGSDSDGELISDGEFQWTPAAMARLNRVPEGFMRDKTRDRILECARQRGSRIIDLDICEAGIALGRKMMEEALKNYSSKAGDGKS